MLELHNVSAANRRITQLNFSVTAGEIVALIGRNGAGKTTLLRLALGLIHPTTGTVHRTVGNGDIGQLIDAPFCYPELTVRPWARYRLHQPVGAATIPRSPLSETVARKQAEGGFSWGVSASAATYRA